MCDQDHFENDREEYEARGLVTRREFGALLGAGMAMLLPQVVNAVAVTESDVSVTTPDGTADCYFVHPASGAVAGVLMWPDIFGRRQDADRRRAAARATVERDHAHDRCEGVHRVAGQAAIGGQEPEDWHAGLLHGWSDGVPHLGGRARTSWCGGLVPRRWARDRSAEQPASAGLENQGALPRRNR